MTAAAQDRVPHLRDSFIVDKVGIERSETVFLRIAKPSKAEAESE
jgi:hypothetical protein